MTRPEFAKAQAETFAKAQAETFAEAQEFAEALAAGFAEAEEFAKAQAETFAEAEAAGFAEAVECADAHAYPTTRHWALGVGLRGTLTPTTLPMMSELVRLKDKDRLARFFGADLPLHIYEMGDLDDFFGPDTQWYGWQCQGSIEKIALLYSGTEIPTLIFLERHTNAQSSAFLKELQTQLPKRYYAHLPCGLALCLGDKKRSHHGRHLKMLLTNTSLLPSVREDDVVGLTPSHSNELMDLYRASYPGHWFLPRMLQSGQYYGIRTEGTLVAAAGVHVYSPSYGVSAAGNITTLPQYRGQGLARRVTGHLCTSLLQHTKTVGLNVHADNAAAIRCYRSIGFEVVAEYDELLVESYSLH